MQKIRCVAVAMIMTCAFLVVMLSHTTFSVAAAEPLSEADLAAFPEETAVLLNEFRAENGLQPLKLAPILLDASRVRGLEQQLLYGHSRPDGRSWVTILDEFGLNSNCYAAENVAAGYATPAEVMEAWKNSPSHRAAMLGEHYQYVGIGVSSMENDPNYYYTYWEMLLISADVPPENAWLPTASHANDESPALTTIEGGTRMGDIDLDNTVSLTDVVLIQRIIQGQLIANSVQLLQADCWEDGLVDQKDVLLLMQYLMQLTPRIPQTPS